MTTPQPNSAQIRKALNNAFDDPQLSAFCFDYFKIIYDKFSRGLRKDEKITLLLDHCQRTDFQKLLEAVRQEYQLSDSPRDELKPLIEALEASLADIIPETTDFLRKNEITNTTLDNQTFVPYNLNEPQAAKRQNLSFPWNLDGLDEKDAAIVQRQDLMDHILKILVKPTGKKTAFLYGPPCVGKTFLLKGLQERLQDQYVAVKINLGGWASIDKLSTFLHELANQLKTILELSHSGSDIAPFNARSESEATIEFTKFMKQLVDYANASQRELLLMFDELDYLIRKETDQQIFEYLSACIETYSAQQVKFIFACSGHMVDLMKSGPLAKLWTKGKAIKVSCFDAKVSQNLISVFTKPHFSLEPKALELLLRLGNGQPALLTHTLPFVVESWKNKEHSNKISENDLINILEEICSELISELWYIWSRFESLEQQLLLHIAQYHHRDKWHEGFKEDEVIMGMENEALIRKSLKRLVRQQILYYTSENKRYMVRLGVILESLSSDMLYIASEKLSS